MFPVLSVLSFAFFLLIFHSSVSLSYFSPLNQFPAHFPSFFITATITAATSGEFPPSQGFRYYPNSSPQQFSKAVTTMMSIYR